MSDPRDLLLDDRPFVKLRRDVVRRRADELHPVLVGLVVWPSATKARQERVMNVDDPARQCIAERRRKHLHVSRQHDEVDTERVDQLKDLRLLLVTRLRRNRYMVERNVVRRRQRLQVRVVRRHRSHDTGQVTTAPSIQQIVEAMAHPRDENEHSLLLGLGVHLPGHAERFGYDAELRTQVSYRDRRVHVHAEKERRRTRASVLLRVEDVAVALSQKARHRMHDAGPVGTRQGEDELPHVLTLSEVATYWARLTAAMSNSSLIFSPTRTPPLSSATWKARPQSRRLTVVLPSKPTRKPPQGSTDVPLSSQLTDTGLVLPLMVRSPIRV